MGLCASMLQRKRKNRHPEPRRGTPKALFVIRNDRRPSNPQALVVQAQNPGGSGFQKPGKAQEISRKHEKCSYDCTDVLGRRLCVPKPRLPCGSTRSVAVEPVAPEWRESVFSGATTERSAVEGCRTPMTPRRTPVWQRRILMGTRCELPRFSGLILYDEHGRPLQSNIQNRADHRISRERKSESKIDVFYYYYPKRLGQVLFVDAPFVFQPLWQMVKPLLKSYASLVRFCDIETVRKEYFTEETVPPDFRN